MINSYNIANAITRELNTDNQIAICCADKIASEATRTGATAHLTAVALAVLMPLVAIADIFERLGKAILCAPVALLMNGARLFGLDSTSEHFSLRAQAWRVAKVLVLLSYTALSTVTIPLVLLAPTLIVREAELLGLRPQRVPQSELSPEPAEEEKLPSVRNSRIVSSLNSAIDSAPNKNTAWYAKVVDLYRSYPKEFNLAAQIAAYSSFYFAWKYYLSPLFNNQATHSKRPANTTDQTTHTHTASNKRAATYRRPVSDPVNSTCPVNQAPPMFSAQPIEDGLYFDGRLEEGTPEGDGNLYKTDDDQCYLLFAGSFQNGLKHGWGTEYSKSGRLSITSCYNLGFEDTDDYCGVIESV